MCDACFKHVSSARRLYVECVKRVLSVSSVCRVCQAYVECMKRVSIGSLFVEQVKQVSSLDQVAPVRVQRAKCVESVKCVLSV